MRACWKCNFPMNEPMNVRLSFGLPVSQNSLKGRRKSHFHAPIGAFAVKKETLMIGLFVSLESRDPASVFSSSSMSWFCLSTSCLKMQERTEKFCRKGQGGEDAGYVVKKRDPCMYGTILNCIGNTTNLGLPYH